MADTESSNRIKLLILAAIVIVGLFLSPPIVTNFISSVYHFAARYWR